MLGNNLLKGEKVYLGAFLEEQVPTLVEWWNNLDVWGWAAYHIAPVTLEGLLERFEKMRESKDFYEFAVYRQEDDALIGHVMLMFIDWKNANAEAGIFIGEQENLSRGYGSEALNLCLRYAFYELNLHRVGLGVYSYNARAIRSYEKIGFKNEGRRRQVITRDGVRHDMIIMSILRSEWRDGLGE